MRLQAQLLVPHGRLADFPPDVARGVDIPPVRVALMGGGKKSGGGGGCGEEQGAVRYAMLSGEFGGDAHSGAGGGGGRVRWSGGVLLSLPSPDASMPFNVVCFVCTCISLLHASLLATLTHRPGFSERKAEEEERLRAEGGERGWLRRLRGGKAKVE